MSNERIIDTAIMVILEDIFQPSLSEHGSLRDDLQLAITLNPDLDNIVLAMQEYGKQLLAKAADNAKIKLDGFVSVDRESILNTEL